MAFMNNQLVPLPIVHRDGVASVALEDLDRYVAQPMTTQRLVGRRHRHLRRNVKHLVKLVEESFAGSEILINGSRKRVHPSRLFAELGNPLDNKHALGLGGLTKRR